MGTLRLVSESPRLEDSFQIVVLDCPARCWDDPRTGSLFHAMIRLKLRGYGSEYPDGVLAIDGTDFFATHLLVCRKTGNGELQPVLGYKSVPLSRARHYRTPFPALTLLRNSGQTAAEARLGDILASCEKRGVDIAYDSAWTMDPECRGDAQLKPLFRDFITVFLLLHHEEFGLPEWVGCGVVRFKTHLHLQGMGYQPITEPFGQASLFGETVVMFHMSEPSHSAQATAERYRRLWEAKIVIQGSPIPADARPEDLRLPKAA